jgi:hypothetical protein
MKENIDEKEMNYKDKLNMSNMSSIQLNIQPTVSVVESLNLIDIKNKNFKKQKMKLNVLNNKKTNENVNINNSNISQINTVSSKEGNTNIKFYQKIIFGPIVFIYIFVEFYLRIFYLINEKEINTIEKKYYKYLIYFHVFLIYLSYFLSMNTDPSQTNINKKYFSNEKSSLLKQNNKLNPYLWNNFCNFCQAQKFIRSNHCNYCNKCILLKFNHCFFIANCIGFKNIQYLINFLLLTICWLYKYQTSYIKYITKEENNYNFLLTIFFVLNFPLLIILFFYFLSLMFDIFNNQTKYERNKVNNLLDKYYPIYKCNDTDNKFRFPNIFNIGYLSNVYYLIGNTLLHFFSPLPKIKNYEIDENCPIFKECRQFDKIEFVNNMSKKNVQYKNSIKERYMEPDNFINFCLKKYNQMKL